MTVSYGDLSDVISVVQVIFNIFIHSVVGTYLNL